jgi:nucleotide-binding universal stress UspA family protein
MADNKNEKTIVVGVDGSPSSVNALHWAVDQAQLTGSSVHVVATWELPTSYGWVPTYPPGFDAAGDVAKGVEKTVKDALGENPPVALRTSVVEGDAAQVLVDLSKGAELLVVGSRGHGAFAGMLLGSVSEYCAAHSHCPVVVVRHIESE